MERELLELASGMLVVWGRLAIGTCLSITESGSIAADGSCLFFSSVFCFLFFSLGDGEPGYRPSTPKVYTGNRRVRKLVGIGADAQPPSPPEDGTLPIVFGGLRRAGRIRIGGSLVGGQERENAPEHIRQDGTRPNRSRETVETVQTPRGQDIAPMKRPAKTGYDTGQERRGQDKRCRLRYHTHHILPLEHNTVQMTSRE